MKMRDIPKDDVVLPSSFFYDVILYQHEANLTTVLHDCAGTVVSLKKTKSGIIKLIASFPQVPGSRTDF